MPSLSHKRFEVLGVHVDALDMQSAAELIAERSQQEGAAYVTKPYVEFLDRARHDPKIRDLLNLSFLVLPDGVSLQWATTYLYGGKPGLFRAARLALAIIFSPRQLKSLIPERFGGTNFTWKLLKVCAASKRRVYLIGQPDQQAIERTRAVILKRLPDLQIVGVHPGSLGGKYGPSLEQAVDFESVERELVEELKQLKPNVILVGMGFPLQEKLMAKLTPQLGHGVLIGEGGTFDYDSFGGNRSKAPTWMQKSGLEWLWRLVLEPRRIVRQMAIPRFMWAVYRNSKSKSAADYSKSK